MYNKKLGRKRFRIKGSYIFSFDAKFSETIWRLISKEIQMKKR
jgi:hypothetical protein